MLASEMGRIRGEGKGWPVAEQAKGKVTFEGWFIHIVTPTGRRMQVGLVMEV